jgi:AraC-like DNA-binding protein
VAPTYREFAPAPALAPFVECFWSVTSETEEPGWLVLPDGCLDIVFWPQGGLRAVGAMTAAQRASIPAGGSVVGVRFRPGMARRFLRVPAGELTDGWAPLDSLWGTRGRELCERLGNADSAHRRVAVLVGGLRPPEGGRDAVARAVSAMVVVAGEADVDAFARQANLSPRQLRRRSIEETGLTPKRLCRILRFRRAVAAAASGARRGWAHLAAQCGYYDQAHLIHEFREFSGYTPAEYAALAVFSNTTAGPALYDVGYETDARFDRGRDREVAAVLG